MLSQNNSVKYFALFAGLLILIGVGGYVFSIQTSGDATSVVEFNATSSDDVGGAISELLATGATSTTRNGYTVEVVPDTAAEVPPPPPHEPR